MDTVSYLNRISCRGSLRPGIDVLRRLHRQHLLTVPFENLDIHLGRPIILDQALFFQKIVKNHRGGYCYELNGCFAWLLKNLGFRVSLLSASVATNNHRYSPDFDHMLLLVRLKEPWMADVGFGDLFADQNNSTIPTHKRIMGGSTRSRKNMGEESCPVGTKTQVSGNLSTDLAYKHEN